MLRHTFMGWLVCSRRRMMVYVNGFRLFQPRKNTLFSITYSHFFSYYNISQKSTCKKIIYNFKKMFHVKHLIFHFRILFLHKYLLSIPRSTSKKNIYTEKTPLTIRHKIPVVFIECLYYNGRNRGDSVRQRPKCTTEIRRNILNEQ